MNFQESESHKTRHKAENWDANPQCNKSFNKMHNFVIICLAEGNREKEFFILFFFSLALVSEYH